MSRRCIAGLRTIVTGASSGIGRALVVELVGRGALVVGMARRRERLEELAEELKERGQTRKIPLRLGEGGRRPGEGLAPDETVNASETKAGETPAPRSRFCYFTGDVTSREDRVGAIDFCCREFGGLDALVNNAGIGGLGPFAQADEARLRQIMEANFFAPTEFIRQALPELRKSERAIVVNIGSVLGHRAVPNKSEYCASKFALHGLSDALRIELGREAIDVLLVSPSTTESEFFDRAIGDSSRPQRHAGKMSAAVVARRAVNAMAAGRREIVLSAGGKALVWLDRLCPPLADWIIARWL